MKPEPLKLEHPRSMFDADAEALLARLQQSSPEIAKSMRTIRRCIAERLKKHNPKGR